MGRNSGKIQHRRVDETFVNFSAVPEFLNVAVYQFESFQEFLFIVSSK